MANLINLVHDGKETGKLLPGAAPTASCPTPPTWPGACGATSLPELFENAGRALSATLTDRRYLRRRATREVSLNRRDREALLVDWLNHLLYLFDVDGFLGRDFQVESLTARASSRPG